MAREYLRSDGGWNQKPVERGGVRSGFDLGFTGIRARRRNPYTCSAAKISCGLARRHSSAPVAGKTMNQDSQGGNPRQAEANRTVSPIRRSVPRIIGTMVAGLVPYLLSIFMRRSAGAGAAAIVGIAVDRSADSANCNTNPAGPYREGLVVRTGLGRKENHQRRSIQSQGPNGGLEDLADWFSSQNYESAKRKIRERAN